MTRRMMFSLLSVFLIVACGSNSSNETGTDENDSLATGKADMLNPSKGYVWGKDIDLDLWLDGFFSPDATTDTTKSSAQVHDDVMAALGNSKSIGEFYKKLLTLGLNHRYPVWEDVSRLVEGLISARMDVRTNSTALAREALLLLETLAEEALYAFSVQNPDSNLEWKTVYEQIGTDECKRNGTSRAADLNGVRICQGDVLISKGSAGSSAFLARITDYPGNYSHSTVAYVAPANAGELYLVEAEITDGVKLRSPKAEYIDARKRKFSVYRFASTNSELQETVRQGAIAGVDALVQEMYTKTSDPFNEVAYPYDFSMSAKDHSELFCSEVTYYAYELSGLDSAYNPYPETLWGTISGINAEFFSNFLNIQSDKLPAPSDIELNPAFELVAFTIDMPRLGLDRIDVAMIDVLLALMKENPDVVREYMEVFKDYGNEPVDKAQIDKQQVLTIAKAMGMSFTEEKLDGLLAQLPANINIKQVIFFTFLNEVLHPTLQAEIVKQEKAYFEKTGKPFGLLTLRVAVKEVLSKMLSELITKLETLTQANP